MSGEPLEPRAAAGFRTLPENVEAEAALLGAILINNEAYHRVSDFLTPEHFYEPVHGRLYAAMDRVIRAGRLADYLTLRPEFDQDEALRELDGAQHLARLARAAETVLNARDYGLAVADLAVRRGLIKTAQDAANLAYDGAASADIGSAEQIARLRQHLEALERAMPAVNGDGLVMLDDCQLDDQAFWAIEDILPRCSMMEIYGRGGCGKTYLATSISLGIASGRWFNHAAEPGAVLYCAFERPEDAEDRLSALREEYDYHGLPLALLKLGGKRLDDQRADAIIRRSKELADRTGMPVRAIPIDTTAAALGGAKEDDEGLGRLRTIGERIHAVTGAIVIWLHHEGKTDGMGPRGHTTLADACLCWWRVEERESGDRVVHVDKANRGPCHVPLFAFKLAPFNAGQDRNGRRIQLCKVEMTGLEAALASPIRKRYGATTPADPEAGLGDRQRLLLRHLRKLGVKHPNGVERATLRSHFLGDLTATRKPNGKDALTPDAYAAIFRQTLGRLRTRNLITEEGDLLWLAE